MWHSRSRRPRRSRSSSPPVQYHRNHRDRSPKSFKQGRSRSRSPARFSRHRDQFRQDLPRNYDRKMTKDYGSRDYNANYYKSHRSRDDRHRSRSPSFSSRGVKSTAFRVRKPAEPYASGHRTNLTGINVEPPPPSRCIGIFGMNFNTTEQDLFDMFTEFGFIDYIRLARFHDTGRSRGFAFIYYDRIECADRAKKELDHTYIGGRRVRIDFARERLPHSS